MQYSSQWRDDIPHTHRRATAHAHALRHEFVKTLSKAAFKMLRSKKALDMTGKRSNIPVVLTEEEADILSVAEAIGLAMFNIIKEEEEVKKEKAPKEESKPAKKEKTKEEEEKSVKKDAPKPAKTQVVEVSSDSESSEEESE